MEQVKNTIKQTALAAALAAGTLGSIPALADEPVKCNGVIKSSVASADTRKAGVIIGDVIPNYTVVAGSCGNLSGYVWHDTDLRTNDVIETDVGISYNQKLTDNLSASAGLEAWKINGFDTLKVGTANLNYSGPVDVSVGATFDLENNGEMFDTRVSKTFKLTDKLSATPYAAASYLNDGFVGKDGLGQVTIGGDLNYTVTDNFGVNAGIKHHDGKNGRPDETVAEIGISYSF